MYGGLFGPRYTKDEARNLLVLLPSVLSTSSPKNDSKGSKRNCRLTFYPLEGKYLFLNNSSAKLEENSHWPKLGDMLISEPVMRAGDSVF